MDELRSRAEAFLSGPRILSEPGGSIGGLIARCVAGDRWDDPGLQDLLLFQLRAARREVARLEGATTYPELDYLSFYQRATAILQDILSTVSADLD